MKMKGAGKGRVKTLCAMATVLLCLSSACKKTESSRPANAVCKTAVVHVINPPIPDLCPLWLSINGGTYLPLNLSPSLLVDSLKINVCYTLTGDSDYCGFVAYKNAGINVIEAERL